MREIGNNCSFADLSANKGAQGLWTATIIVHDAFF